MKLGLGFFRKIRVGYNTCEQHKRRSRRVEPRHPDDINQQHIFLLVQTMLARAVRAANPLRAHARAMTIAVGSKFPSVEVDKASWPPEAFNIADHIANKKVIVVGLPGAFTPT